MTNIEFFPITINSETTPTSKEIIEIFGKTIDGKRICVIDDSFKNYFWVLANKDTSNLREKIEKIKIQNDERTVSVIKTEIHKKNYLNQPVKAIKVFTNHSEDISMIKEEILEPCNEIDIPLTRRYLIDKKITPLRLCNVEGELIKTNSDSLDYTIRSKRISSLNEEFQNPKMLAFDIEVLTQIKGFPDSNKDPIIMISLIGSGYTKVITWKKFESNLGYIIFVDNESELIKEFKKVIKEYKPDFLIGYNSTSFDLPYIGDRAKKYNIPLNLNIDGTNIKFSRSGRIKIKGISHIDLYTFIRNIMADSLKTDSFSLKQVSKELLGLEKNEFDFRKLKEKWDSNDIEDLCEYNLKDSLLTLELYKKILPNLEEMVKLIGLPPSDICRMKFSQLVEGHILKNLDKFNEIAPNKPDYKEIKQREFQTFKGAFVFKPNAGLYKNIVFMDYRSLYPSIIVAKNICPSTITENREGSYPTPRTIINNKEETFFFTYKKEGIIPQILKDLIERRIRIKELIKNNKEDLILKARSQSIKTLTNATYGYFGFFAARYYSIECAASITSFGREFVQDTIKKAETFGFKIIYSDTDSVAIILEDKTMEDITKFLNKINSELPSLMELELEGFYPRGIFVLKKNEQAGAKKKYALLQEDGKILIKGFETVRRDWSLISKEAQTNVLNLTLKENDITKAKEYIKNLIQEVKDHKIPLEKTIIQTKLQKELKDYITIGPHVAVAIQLKNKGEVISPGKVIEYIVSQGTGLVRDKAKPIEEAKNYDPDYYINNQIIPAVEMIFSVVNINKRDLLNDKKQSNLGDFQ